MRGWDWQGHWNLIRIWHHSTVHVHWHVHWHAHIHSHVHVHVNWDVHMHVHVRWDVHISIAQTFFRSSLKIDVVLVVTPVIVIAQMIIAVLFVIA